MKGSYFQVRIRTSGIRITCISATALARLGLVLSSKIINLLQFPLRQKATRTGTTTSIRKCIQKKSSHPLTAYNTLIKRIVFYSVIPLTTSIFCIKKTSSNYQKRLEICFYLYYNQLYNNINKNKFSNGSYDNPVS